MNYHHAYHAGNFADVIKHILLTALLTSLSKKEKPLCYLDTHAGMAYYDLFSDTAQKNKEYMNGIEKIIRCENPPPLVQYYLNCIHQINNQLLGVTFASLRYYPGSTLIARQLLRPHDRVVACELQLPEYQALKAHFMGDKQVAIHHMDGFLGLKGFLPPTERRGLILIDPPYEDPNEWMHIAKMLPVALKRFETGVYAIWYPIKEKNQLERFYQTVQSTLKQPVLAVELTIFPDLPQHLNGSGLMVVNPPWQLDETLQTLLPWVWKALTINGQGAYRTFSLS